MIVLFTTTKRILYKRDILNTCCFEDGSLVRFGYRRDWVAKELSPNRGQAMNGKRAVLVYCDWNGNPDADLTYYPLRLAKILNVDEDVFGSFAITLELSKFFSYQRADANALLEKIQENISRFSHRPNTTKKERESSRTRKYLTAEGEWLDEHFTGEWDSLVGRFGQLYDFKESVFFRLSQGTSKVSFPAPKWKPLPCRAEFSLHAGKQYDLRLKMLSDSVDIFRGPDCVCHGEHVIVLGPFLKQSSEGVEADYSVITKRSYQDEVTTLSLKMPPKSGASESITSPELHAILSIKAGKTLLVAAIALMVIGSLAQAVDANFLEAFGMTKGMAFAWSLAPKIGGALVIGLGAYLGFNRLPIKDLLDFARGVSKG